MSQESRLEVLNQARAALQKPSPARERLTKLFDEGTFAELDAFVASGEAGAGVITGYGSIMGCPVYAFSQDGTENSGAMSQMQALKINKIYEMALKTGAPRGGHLRFPRRQAGRGLPGVKRLRRAAPMEQ